MTAGTALRQLDETVSVAGQIWPHDLESLKAQGFTLVINNRPDGEEARQPLGPEIEAAAKAAGLDYRFVPVGGGFSAAQVAAMVDALRGADGRAIAFCKSGTRSAFLWALARAREGVPADQLIASAAAAGYDLTPIRLYLG
jgi:uncharacterized protein (TIGR01244 family)